MSRESLQLKAFRSASLPVWAATGAVLAVTVFAWRFLGVPPHEMMGDPAAVTGRPFYVGWVSNVGVLMWAATASVFFFTACVQPRRSEWRPFLVASGALAGLLGVDDLFMLHEQVFPAYLSISQTAVVGAYGLLALAYLARFASSLAHTAFPVFLAAMAMLGASAAHDQVKDVFGLSYFGSGFVEDGIKLFGIGTWMSYALHTCAAVVRGQPAPAPFALPVLRSRRAQLQ